MKNTPQAGSAKEPIDEKSASTSLSSIIRNCYRDPIDETDDITLSINGNELRILDLGPYGIGASLKSPKQFTVGEVYQLNVTVEGHKLEFLGRVVHISLDPPSRYICGMEQVNISAEDKKILDAFREKKHAQIFKSR